MSHKIDWYDPDFPQLEIILQNRRRISFSVSSVDRASHEWMGGVVERIIEEEIEYAVKKALNEHRAAQRALLGL